MTIDCLTSAVERKVKIKQAMNGLIGSMEVYNPGLPVQQDRQCRDYKRKEVREEITLVETLLQDIQTFDDQGMYGRLLSSVESLAKETRDGLGISEIAERIIDDLDILIQTRPCAIKKSYQEKRDLLFEIADAITANMKRRTNADQPQWYQIRDQEFIFELETIIRLHTSTPRIGKSNAVRTDFWYDDNERSPRPYYSLWVSYGGEKEKSPVFLYENGEFKQIRSTRKDAPFTIDACMQPLQALIAYRQRRLQIGLQEGEFYDICLRPLTGESRRIAAEVFKQVKEGVEIFPEPKEQRGYKVREKGRGTGSKRLPRTEGQLFLETLSPEEIIEGQLFGSGHSFCAYVIRGKVVVESDESGDATYVFSREQFESLRTCPRSTLLRQQPDGFAGRVIHKDEQWKEGILAYISAE
jgi:hypothetical protein